MNWIFWTTIMFIASNILYICIRELKQYQLPASFLNLGVLGLPIFPLIIYIYSNNLNFNISFERIVIILMGLFFFSFLGNQFSMIALNHSPNQGLSLIIQKSYGSFTLFLAPIFFNAELTEAGVLGSLVVLVAAFLVSVDLKQKTKANDKKWIVFTLMAYLSFGFLSLFAKYLFNSGVEVHEFMFFAFLVTGSITATKTLSTRRSFSLSKKLVTIICTTAIASFIFNMTMFQAIEIAPNVGYVNIANVGSVAMLALITKILYGDELNLQKSIGLVGMFFGMVMILI